MTQVFKHIFAAGLRSPTFPVRPDANAELKACVHVVWERWARTATQIKRNRFARCPAITAASRLLSKNARSVRSLAEAQMNVPARLRPQFCTSPVAADVATSRRG